MPVRDYRDTNFITSLRAVAILLVFLIHAGGGGLRELGGGGNFLVDLGAYGVSIFFVISGFTIFSQFFSEKYTLKKFLLVRISRISIPYYPILIWLFITTGTVSLLNLLAHIFYISPYIVGFQNSILKVEWTLGVEVFFYFLFGLLISTKLFKLNKSSFTVFGVLFLIAQLIVVLLGRLFKIDPVVMHWLPFSYGYMFFLGGLAYYLRERFAKAVYPKLSEKTISDIVLSTILAATIILIAFHKSGVMELTFVLATFLIIVFFKNGGKLSILLDNKILLFLGSISYSFYLLHFNIVPPVTGIVYLDFFIRLAAAVIVSTVWYYIFEKNIYTMVKRRIKSIT